MSRGDIAEGGWKIMDSEHDDIVVQRLVIYCGPVLDDIAHSWIMTHADHRSDLNNWKPGECCV